MTSFFSMEDNNLWRVTSSISFPLETRDQRPPGKWYCHQELLLCPPYLACFLLWGLHLRVSFGRETKLQASLFFTSRTLMSNPINRQSLHQWKFQIFKKIRCGNFPWRGQWYLGDFVFVFIFLLIEKKSFTSCQHLWLNHRSFSFPDQNAFLFLGLRQILFPLLYRLNQIHFHCFCWISENHDPFYSAHLNV